MDTIHPTKLLGIKPNETEQKRLYIVLIKASLETVKTKKGYELVCADSHKGILSKLQADASEFRPDIVHQCLLILLDSPLNKAGHLKVFVQTTKNVLIEVSPHIRIPRTYKRFSGLMVQLLHKLKIRAQEGSGSGGGAGGGDVLLKVVKNPVTQYLPVNCRKFGTSVTGELVDLREFVPFIMSTVPQTKPIATATATAAAAAAAPTAADSKSDAAAAAAATASDTKSAGGKKSKKQSTSAAAAAADVKVMDSKTTNTAAPATAASSTSSSAAAAGAAAAAGGAATAPAQSICWVFGSHAHGPASVDWVERNLALSQYPLSAAAALSRLCTAYEQLWGIL